MASKNLVMLGAFTLSKRTRSKAGAARGTRTPDPVITNDVLYQLSYCGRPCNSRALRDGLKTRAHLISGTAPIGKAALSQASS